MVEYLVTEWVEFWYQPLVSAGYTRFYEWNDGPMVECTGMVSQDTKWIINGSDGDTWNGFSNGMSPYGFGRVDVFQMVTPMQWPGPGAKRN